MDDMLSLQHLSKNFGGLQALDDVSFQVRKGSITSLIGPNGAGKTTLFNCVSGVSPATSGQVLLRDVKVTSLPSHSIAALGMARTFQNIRPFGNLNVLENVIAAAYCRTRSGFLDSVCLLDRAERKRMRTKAEELLEWVGISQHRFQMPSALPYGDQRRLEIARALITAPQLLMLDEPFAGMSLGESTELVGLVGQLRQSGMTIFLIEHNVHVVMNVSDQVMVLNFGRKIAEGTPAEVQASPAVIEAYLGIED